MATATHEQTINTAFAEVVEGVGRGWSIRAENVGGVFEGGGRPDVLIEKGDGWPIVIEAEAGNHHQAEVGATSRLTGGWRQQAKKCMRQWRWSRKLGGLSG